MSQAVQPGGAHHGVLGPCEPPVVLLLLVAAVLVVALGTGALSAT